MKTDKGNKTELESENKSASKASHNYTFVKGTERLTFEAASYQEAVAALIFRAGSEPEAAEYIFLGMD